MMATKPLISVILCNYNYGRFIGQAIDSVLSQTYTNFELIIVDDGSTDDSREIISTYTDSRIKIVFKQNGGQASAFNVGFEKAKGEIICFLDSDDLWLPEKLSTILKWDEFLGREYVILQHNLDIWNGHKRTPYKAILPMGNCFDEMVKTGNINFFVPTSGLSFPRYILTKVFPIPEKFTICADAYLMRTAFIFGKVGSIPEILGLYRQHNNSVFRNKQFNHSNFFKTTLFPELNNFYQLNNIKYKLKINNDSAQKKWLRSQIKKIPGAKMIYSLVKGK